MTSAADLRAALVAELIAVGDLRDPGWIAAFRAVPREAFARRYFLVVPDGGHTPVGTSDPDWLPPIYSDRVLPIQLDGDDDAWSRARGDGTQAAGVPTCSLSRPGLTARVLEALDVEDDDVVLEVGTGTGYSAALLAHRLGDVRVTTVDDDPTLTADARRHLAHVRSHPAVVTGDGLLGVPEYAPYDRIVATCSVPAVPLAWLDQTRPGGRVVAGLHRPLCGGFLVGMTVAPDGSASGHLLPVEGSYPPTRATPVPDADALLRAAAGAESAAHRTTEVTFRPRDGAAWHVLADLTLPDVVAVEIEPVDATRVVWLLHPDGSWAYADARSSTVDQGGPRRLWDVLEGARQRWNSLGRPARERFGLHVRDDGRHALWLDDPGHVVVDVG